MYQELFDSKATCIRIGGIRVLVYAYCVCVLTETDVGKTTRRFNIAETRAFPETVGLFHFPVHLRRLYYVGK